MLLRDAASVDGFRTTRDGYLVADVRIARTGVYDYLGREVGRPDLGTVRVMRPASVVFDAGSMRSFALRPITLDHPSEPVTSATWRAQAVGSLGDEIRRDGQFLRATAVIHDAAAIEAVRGGRRELSVGYTTELVWTGGTTDGVAYQARQTAIRANHVAIVERGRAGALCAIGRA